MTISGSLLWFLTRAGVRLLPLAGSIAEEAALNALERAIEARRRRRGLGPAGSAAGPGDFSADGETGGPGVGFSEWETADRFAECAHEKPADRPREESAEARPSPADSTSPFNFAALMEAWTRLRARGGGSAGIDGVTVDNFATRWKPELEQLGRELRIGTYQPQPLKAVGIAKESGGIRNLAIPTVRDRIVQAALAGWLTPLLDPRFHERSFAWRPGRGCHDALDEVTRQIGCGECWIVRADIRDCFDSIPHEPLIDRLREERIGEPPVLGLISQIVSAPVIGRRGRLQVRDRGVPQGAALAPLLCNFYLDPLDRAISDGGWELIRYGDDIVIACQSAAEARDALDRLHECLNDLGLILNESKTQVIRPGEAFDFLGHEIDNRKRGPARKSIARIKRRLGKTLSRKGRTAVGRIHKARGQYRSWRAYFEDSDPSRLNLVDEWAENELKTGAETGNGKEAQN